MFAKHVGLLALIAAAVLLPGGCGGDDEESAESWASSVCSNLSEWLTDVEGAVTSLTEEGALDEAALRTAVDETRDATDELASDLEQLDPPETEGSQEAEEELDELTAELRDQSEEVERALDANGEPLALAATVGAALSAAANQLRQAFENLQGLDRGGELGDAFRDSEDCDSLREQVENLGS